MALSWFSTPAPPRANVYADHPFKLLATPVSKLPPGTTPNRFHTMASEMVNVHNMLFRGLNSIYLQAPHVQPADAWAFSNYMHQWNRITTAHHEGEEALVFPAIERHAGVPGLMDVNVQQHAAFHGPLVDFAKYAEACAQGKAEFDGQKVVTMIDAFGVALTEHLNDEIDSLLALERFGDEKMAGVEKALEEEGEKNMKSMGIATGAACAILNLDRHFEDDRWTTKFPPGTAGQLASAAVRNVAYWVHSDWWRFAACDRTGTMQKLYAAVEE